VPRSSPTPRLLRSPEEAEDVFGDTFIRVARAGGRWERRGSFRGYLFTIAHRLCVDILRKRRVEAMATPTLIALADSRQVTPSPEALASLGERATQLEQALAQLPEEHRTVLLLRAVHGLSGSDTARVVGIKESQVHSQLAYARKKLTELLPEERFARKGRRS
jgi:RNA polymerase sigma-70 factor (ECF subfamily)